MYTKIAVPFMALLASSLASYTPPHPCSGYKTKLPKLQSCATASAFCTAVLGDSGDYTKTKTTVLTVAHSTTTHTSISTITETDYSDTITLEAPTATISTDTTTTSTTTQAVCNPPKVKRSPGAAKSCGIFPRASPALVTAACECYLASTVTATSTKTLGGPETATVSTTTSTTNTITTDSTTYTTPTSTVYTATVTESACATYTPFIMQVTAPGTAYDGLYIFNDDINGGYHVLAFTSDITQAFVFEVTAGGVLTDAATGLSAASNLYDGGQTPYYAVEYQYLPNDPEDGNYVPITCSIDNAVTTISCTGSYGSTSYGCSGAGNNIGWSLGPANALTGSTYNNGLNPSQCAPINFVLHPAT